MLDTEVIKKTTNFTKAIVQYQITFTKSCILDYFHALWSTNQPYSLSGECSGFLRGLKFKI